MQTNLMQCATYGLSTDKVTHSFNLCSNAGNTHTYISQTQPLYMTLSTFTQLLWSTMARLLHDLGHRLGVTPPGPHHHTEPDPGGLHTHIYIVLVEGYKKISKTVAKIMQRFNRTGSTQNSPHHGRPKKLSEGAQRHIQRLCLGYICMSVASIAAQVEGVGHLVSAQTIHWVLNPGCRRGRRALYQGG